MLVSVCMPVYQGSTFIEAALHAVLQQTYRHVEILISLDKSVDEEESEAIVRRVEAQFPAARIELFRQKVRLNWIRNTNFLLNRARGGYIAILPHDDWIINRPLRIAEHGARPPSLAQFLGNCL